MDNTKIKIESLGDVELKYISGGDTMDFFKFLDKGFSDKDFVSQIIFHQIVNPKITYSDFQKISDNQLEILGRALVANEPHFFKNFKDNGNFFGDFAHTIINDCKEREEKMKKTFEPIIKSAQESYNQLAKNIAGINSKLKIPNLYEQEKRDWIFVDPATTREQNAWERHREILNIQNALVSIQAKLLNEQLSNTKLTKFVLWLTIAGIIVSIASLGVDIFKR